MCEHKHPENPIHDSASFKIQSHGHHIDLLLSHGLLWAGVEKAESNSQTCFEAFPWLRQTKPCFGQ